METISSDIVIAGAGPAGATMALMLAGSGITVTLVDKDRFPRNKICGDALSGKVLSILRRMPADVYNEFISSVAKTPSSGIRFVSPGLHEADINFPSGHGSGPPGFICPRREFDAFLVSKLKGFGNIRLIEGEKATSIERGGSAVTLVTANYRITGKVIA